MLMAALLECRETARILNVNRHLAGVNKAADWLPATPELNNLHHTASLHHIANLHRITSFHHIANLHRIANNY